MNNKTGKQLAAAISELAKAIDRLAAKPPAPSVVVQNDRRDIPLGGWSGGSSTIGGVGGSPGGVSPRLTGGGGGGGGSRIVGGAALSMVGEAEPEYLNLGGGQYWLINRSA